MTVKVVAHSSAAAAHSLIYHYHGLRSNALTERFLNFFFQFVAVAVCPYSDSFIISLSSPSHSALQLEMVNQLVK